MFPGDMVLSLVVPTGTVLINPVSCLLSPVLSCRVHGDSSGADMEAVAEGFCKGP